MKSEIASLWFVRLRWFSFLGQLMVLAAALWVFDLTIPWQEILSLLFLIPLSNLCALTPFGQRVHEGYRADASPLIGSLLALDTLILTGVLYFAGGPTNPFTIVYLLYVVLAAVMLSTSWTWAITALSSLGFATLFFYSRAVPEWEHHGAHHGFSLHLHGMLFAYVVVAILVTYFLNKIVGDLRKKERAFERLQNNALNQQRLASLTTITAGAAHELGTPLGTIAVVAHELGRTIAMRHPDKDLLEDIELLKSETARCKEVLQQLAEKTGDLLGEAPQAVVVRELIHDAVTPLRFNVPLDIRGETELLMSRIPRKSVTMAVRALIKNAYEASDHQSAPVEVVVSAERGMMRVEIRDHGTGMNAETLERVGEPFFSMKRAANGMGLGVYLARLTFEQLGGSLAVDSTLGQGTVVRLSFPIDCSQVSKAA